uniref:Uncharacterized protein n=1 Tax=Setaria viridis TaxID=4556 RepID=A0A4V6Y8T6_SETVI|nr:hypothetical protein SEVIR_2G104100v2 [Setaria viridis]
MAKGLKACPRGSVRTAGISAHSHLPSSLIDETPRGGLVEAGGDAWSTEAGPALRTVAPGVWRHRRTTHGRCVRAVRQPSRSAFSVDFPNPNY